MTSSETVTADLLRRAADRLDLLREHAEYPSPWDEPLAAWLREVAPYFTALSNEEARPAAAVAQAILGDDQ